eukprot:3284141-Amphidinium_carterae.1
MSHDVYCATLARYVQHPLGYPNDYHRKTKPMRIWADATALMQARMPSEQYCHGLFALRI